MNYDKIILELLDRIKTLEEKVAFLENQLKQETNPAQEEKGSLTGRAREYINFRKAQAREAGMAYVDLLCNDIQKELGIINRAPAICTAMYACCGPKDQVLYAPPSGKSTTVKIRYYVR